MDKAKEVTAIRIIALRTSGSQDLSLFPGSPKWSGYVQIPAFYQSPITSRLPVVVIISTPKYPGHTDSHIKII